MTVHVPASSEQEQKDQLTADDQQPEINIVDAAETPQQEQSATKKKRTSEKGTKTNRRKTARAFPSQDDLAQEFNQY